MRFKAVTWNILANAYINGTPFFYPHIDPQALDLARRRALLLDTIAAQDADLYMLQEVEPDAFAAILARLGSGYTGHLEQHARRKEGCALITRDAAITVTSRFCLAHASRNKLTPLARLRVGRGDEAREVHVASVHLSWAEPGTPEAEHDGWAQLREVLAYRAAQPDTETPWIIAGDFNTLSESPLIREAEASGLALSCRSQRPWDTCNVHRKCRKLDYMLYTPGALIPTPRPLPRLTRDTLMPSDVFASDHLPIEVSWRWDDAR